MTAHDPNGPPSAPSCEALPAAALAKLDARLAEAWSSGATHFDVQVDFRTPPPQAELAALGVAAIHDLCIGRVNRSQLRALAEHPEVTHLSGLGSSHLR